MSGSKNRRHLPRDNRGSLLSPEAVGGITAGKGFDFQTRYAACQLPVWLQDSTFHQLFFEGTGDIDVRYSDNDQSSRIHIQVRDHEVTASEFKSAVASFQQLDSRMPGVYRRFVLACPGLSKVLRPVETGLARFRNAIPFYDDLPSALAPTKDEVDKRLRKAGLGQYTEFIHSKVFIEVGHGDLHKDERAAEVFVARLMKHPEYSQKLLSMIQPAFAEVLRAIGAKKGEVLERGVIEELLRSAVASAAITDKGITVWVQNWTKESFDLPADYVLDWSSDFDRSSRRVPTPQMWEGKLVPELMSVKQKILAERTERLIRFRGKCALSTGITFGCIFPAVGGWTFEIPQPPSKESWRSDAVTTNSYDLRLEIDEVDDKGSDLVLGLNIRGDGRNDVRAYIEQIGDRPRLFAFVSPTSQGAQAIGGAGEACAFARTVRDHLGQLVKKYQIRRTRIFFYGPFALAVFLGQYLTSVGEVQLFEYQDPGYVPSCTLRT